MIAPIKTRPVFKQYIWGGDALKKVYNKNIPDNFAAESWEISCLDDGLTEIAEGKYQGKTLKEVIYANEKEMLGDKKYDQFPLLVKLIDANNNLSVQVHPDNEYARIHENGALGKTEMWYVIDAKPGAKLVYGFKCGTTKEMFEKAVKDENLEPLLNYVEVKKGDSFFIPSKTLHAIGEGLLIAEIQQSSNLTYRVYDYNRVDKDGNKRPLHTQKALDVTSLENVEGRERIVPVVEKLDGCEKSVLVDCKFFKVEKFDVQTKTEIKTPDNRFELLVFTDGGARIEFDGGCMDINPGDSVFVPASVKEYTVSGKCTFLRSYI